MVNVSDATFVNLDQLGPNSTFVTIRPVSSDSLAVPSTSSEQPIVIENEDPQMGPDQNPCSSNANKKISAHMNPNWLENLLQNFKAEIISPCARKVQEAVEHDTVFENVKEKRDVRMAIKNSIVNKLVDIFGGVSRPEVKCVRKIVNELTHVYPAMFKNDASTGYGLGGMLGTDGFANQILDAVRRIDGRAVAKKGPPDVDSVASPSGQKKKNVYGVDAFKYNAANVKTRNPEVSLKISETSDENLSFNQREDIYDENREDLQKEFRSSKKAILNQCRGFWKDYRHLENHFKYLTNSEGLTSTVEANYSKQMEHLELYLKHVNTDINFIETMEDIDRKCEITYNGSNTYKHIMVLRLVGDKLDKDRSVLIRLDEDGPSPTDSPHIYAIPVDK